MSKASIILLTLSAILLANHVSSQLEPTKPTYFWETCPVELGNYTANSTYETNIKAVLSDLQQHASVEMFHNSSAGNGTNTVYGQYYCRGDVDADFCSQCIKEAAEAIQRNCTGFKSSVMYYQECTLRYRNESIYGTYNPNDWGSYSYYSSLVLNPGEFIVIFNDTMNTLIQKAAYGKDTIKFATTEVALSSAFETLNSLVQCSPDLNGKQCESCLQSRLISEETCCGNYSQGVYEIFPACQMMYNTIARFYYTPNAPPPPPSPLKGSPPPPSPVKAPRSPQMIGSGTTPPPPNNGGSAIITNSENLKLGIAAAAVVLLMLVLNS